MARKILFICTANQCRSPMAEGIFRKILQEAGRNEEFKVESAGVLKEADVPASEPACEVMKRRGIDISAHMSRHITKKIAGDAELILTMTRAHKEKVLSQYPEFAGRIYTLSEYAEGKMFDIPDPVGMDAEAYGIVAQIIEKYLRGVAGKL